MDSAVQDRHGEREQRQKASLERHERLSRLFREDRLAFERERKKMIQEVIESAEHPEQREKLRALQGSWDKRMRGAGSEHNRLVLAQAFFWDHFHTAFRPAVDHLKDLVRQQHDQAAGLAQRPPL
ncbi:MAG: DUF3135 domain-containing protein [Desulfobacterota bacterium]|jgi:hypothetical protein|nr:DUF3135 domain-containing protein [Thermodesulfobacteriota bacterium]